MYTTGGMRNTKDNQGAKKKEEMIMAREWDPAEEGCKAARRDNAARSKSAQIIGRLIDYRGKPAKVVEAADGFVSGGRGYWVRMLADTEGNEILVTRTTILAKLRRV